MKYVTEFDVVAEYDRKRRFGDIINPVVYQNQLRKTQNQALIYRLRKRSESERPEAEIKDVIYDENSGAVITASSDRLSLHGIEQIKENKWWPIEHYLRPHDAGGDEGYLNRIIGIRSTSHGESKRGVLLCVRESQDQNVHFVTLCNIQESVKLQEYYTFQVDGFNPGGDVQLTSDCIAMTTRKGVEMIDFRRAQRRTVFKLRDDFLRLDFSGDMIGCGTRNGIVHFVDVRSGEKLRNCLSTGHLVSNLKFFKDDKHKFLVNGVDDYFALYDIRSMKAPLLRYKNFNNHGNLQSVVDVRDSIIMIKDGMGKIKVYDTLQPNPINEIGNCTKVDKFIRLRNELCVLRQGKLEYWS